MKKVSVFIFSLLFLLNCQFSFALASVNYNANDQIINELGFKGLSGLNTSEITIVTNSKVSDVKMIPVSDNFSDNDLTSVTNITDMIFSDNNEITWKLEPIKSAVCKIALADISNDWYVLSTTFNINVDNDSSSYKDNTGNTNNGIDKNSSPWPKADFNPVSVYARNIADDKRIYTYVGPGKSYAIHGGYRDYKINSLTALFKENGYVYVDTDYRTTARRCTYFKESSLTDSSYVQTIQFQGYSATLNRTLKPSFGPGSDYGEFLDEKFRDVTLSQGSHLEVLTEYNNYVFAEFEYSGRFGRAWFPVSSVDW